MGPSRYFYSSNQGRIQFISSRVCLLSQAAPAAAQDPYQKQGVGSLSHFESRSLQMDSEPNSILRQEGNINGRGNLDNLPRWRQPARGRINLENDNVVRELVLRQQVLAARAKRHVSRPRAGIQCRRKRIERCCSIWGFFRRLRRAWRE